MLSQRISNESQQALQGNAASFARLRDSRERFGLLLNALMSGGEVGGLSVPAASASDSAVIQNVKALWDKTNKNAGLVISQEKNLVNLGQAVRTINADNPALLDLAEQVAGPPRCRRNSARCGPKPSVRPPAFPGSRRRPSPCCWCISKNSV